MKNEELETLLTELINLPKENEWVEFKHNNDDPQMIGEDISALSNSAALLNRPVAYMVWGIEDTSHRLIGTSFKPTQAKHKQQELESWLLQKIDPKIDFQFFEFDLLGLNFVILEIQATTHKPVRFDGTEYLRIGSYAKKLRDYPEKERKLWRALDKTPFERQIAMAEINGEKVLQLLDFTKYFDITKQPLPQTQQGILEKLADEKLIHTNGLHWDITNLGAIVFAKKLTDFDHLAKKAVRIIRYKGNDKFNTIQEIQDSRTQAGYAIAFEAILQSIKALVPSYEEIGLTYRKEIDTYPDIALRELVANALIHQDFNLSGTSPMIEIFNHRIEITNSGSPLVEVNRFMDKPPCSRNEHLAALMRRLNICEERGSGIDKVIRQIELSQMPAPHFENLEQHTKAILFAYKPFGDISREERLRSCYWHCVFKYVIREQMSNSSLRQRFGNSVTSAMISKIIKEAQEKQLIKVFDEEVGTKAKKYIPIWA